MNYSRVVIDPARKDYWFLDEPVSKDGQPIDAREFTQGRPYKGLAPYRVPIAQPGKVTELTLAAFDMPVISDRVGGILDSFAGLPTQRFPIVVGSVGPGFEILNVTACADCLDEELSEVMWWTPGDGRPEKVGQYRMVTNLTIDPHRVDGRDIFRVKGWEVALIVSDNIRLSLEGLPGLGVVFEPVC